MDNHIAHYTQWFPGKENLVADMLLRDFTLSDGELVLLCAFAILYPRAAVISYPSLSTTMLTSVGRLLCLLPKTQQLPTEPVPSTAAAGHVSKHSPRRLASVATRSYRAYDPTSELRCSLAMRPPSEKVGHATPAELWDLALDSRQAQFVPPSTAWYRPIGLTNLAARSTTPEDKSNPFWLRN
jgi:hypothetical protein